MINGILFTNTIPAASPLALDGLAVTLSVPVVLSTTKWCRPIIVKVKYQVTAGPGIEPLDQQVNLPHATWHPVAAVAGWLLPGLGHVMVGQARRGRIIALTIGSLWLAGLLIGSVSVIDRIEHRAWFAGQLLIAPSILSDYLLQNYIKPGYRSPYGQTQTSFEPSFGRAREQGILYTALAGLLNLMAMLDVLYREPPHKPIATPAPPS
jgi:hypothetical protein